MHMLESAMAFAVVMIIFSTIVTGLVEAVLRVAALRRDTLTRTLRLFLANEVAPTLKNALKQAQAAVQTVDDSAEFIEKMVTDFTRNPVQSRRRTWFARMLAPRIESIDELTAYSFLQRLAKSDMSETIRALDDRQLNNFLANITRTYDRYMAASTEFYRKKSHILTIFVAMSLALVFNVPAARVYMHLMDNPETRAELINQAEEAIAQEKETRKSLEAFWEAQRDRTDRPDQPVEGAEAPANEETANGGEAATEEDTSVQATQAAPMTAEQVKEEEKRIAEEIAALRGALDSLRVDAGLPIGPSMWPYCYGASADDNAECTPAELDKKTWLDLVYWLFNVILAGVLIGLGGPFWAKVYTRLAQFAGRPVSRAENDPELVGAGEVGVADPKKAAQNPAAAFRIAAGDVTLSETMPPPA